MESFASNPVIAGLRDYYNSTQTAREILDHLSGSKHDRKITYVKRLHRRLSRDGSMVERPEIVEFFQKLHGIGLGEFVSGEGVRRPRFVWGYPHTQLAGVASGEAWVLEPLPSNGAALNGHDDGDEDDDLLDDDLIEDAPAVGGPADGVVSAIGPTSAIKHIYRLRGNYTVKLRLPLDLTPTEAGRLADFIRTLPFGS